MKRNEIVKYVRKKRGIARGVISNKTTRADTRAWYQKEVDLYDAILGLLGEGKLSIFDMGRIEGAMVYWRHFAQDDQVAVPGVDKMLQLPPGTTRKYLDANV